MYQFLIDQYKKKNINRHKNVSQSRDITSLIKLQSRKL